MPKLKSNLQIKRIFGLAKPLGCSKEDLEDLAFEISEGRVDRLSQLTFDEANAMIVRLGGVPLSSAGSSKRNENYRKQSAGIKTIETEAHLHKIYELGGLRQMNEDGLRSLATRMSLPWPPSTTEQGNKIVEALKAMNRRDGLLKFRPKKEKAPRQPSYRKVA